MPSMRHETLLELFRNRPALAAELLALTLDTPLPAYTEARVVSAELSEVEPAEYRADLVVLLRDDAPVFGIVVEVQLGRDARKRQVWPVYAVELRARLQTDTCVLVICPDEPIARWAAEPIALGAGNVFRPVVIGPSGVPVVDDPAVATEAPELAVLSALAHGGGPDSARAGRVAAAALEALVRLDDPRALLYNDMVFGALSEAARRALKQMDPAKYEYQSDFARRYVAEGRADVVAKLLRLRFGEAALDEQVIAHVRDASLDELDAMAERILFAETLEDVIG